MTPPPERKVEEKKSPEPQRRVTISDQVKEIPQEETRVDPPDPREGGLKLPPGTGPKKGQGKAGG